MTYQAQSNEQLLRTCAASNDAAAWEEFLRRFQPLIATVIFRVAERWGQASSGLVDELVQETFLKLCRNGSKALKDFHPEHDGAVYGFLKTVAMNVAIDHFRSARAANSTETIEEHASLPSTAKEDPDTAVLLSQVDGALRRNTSGQTRDRDRMVFWLYYRHGLTARAIAAVPSLGLTVKGVETVIFRLTKAIRKELGGSAVGRTLNSG